jgi:elongation factor G
VLPDGTEGSRPANDTAPFAALAFKIATDTAAGNLTFLRVYSGVLQAGESVYNASCGTTETVGQLVQMHANERLEIDEVRAGDIVAAVGLGDVATGETLTAPGHAITLEKIDFPEPVIAVAIEPRTSADQVKLAEVLERLTREDPTFRVRVDAESGQTVVSGMGELHLEIIVERLRRDFGVDVNAGRPQVAYRETIRKSVEQDGKFVRQGAEQGQYGHVVLKLEPREAGKGYEFVDATAGDVVPREFVPAVDQGVREQMATGIVAGYPVVDVRVTLVAGSHHATDSTAAGFRLAGAAAFKEGAKTARPVLLEPVMNVQVVTPDAYMGDVNGDIARRRGVVQALDDSPAGKIVRARVPLAEMFGYATKLRSLSQGRATYTMQFSEYAEVPANVIQNVIRDRAA